MQKISIIIPLYNERDNILDLYNEITDNIEKFIDYEIIFINDGSTDKSDILLRDLEKNFNVKVVNHKKNLGSSRFRKHLYNVKYFKTNSELMKLIRDFKPDIIFNDILNTSSQYMKSLKKNNSFIVNFEDLGHGRKFSDLTFNPIFTSCCCHSITHSMVSDNCLTS